MRGDRQKGTRSIGFVIGVAMVVLGIAACSQSGTGSRMGAMMGAGTPLSGAQEVPAVNTQATGVSSIIVSGDKNISGEVRTTNLNGTAFTAIATTNLSLPATNLPSGFTEE